MKNPVKSILIILISIALAVTAAGCTDPLPPEPAPKPTATGPMPTPPPSPETAPPAPATKEPQEPEQGPLELETYYFLFGDPQNTAVLFSADGLYVSAGGAEAEFELEGNSITLSVGGEPVAWLRIIDEYTIEEPATGMQYIREGGPGYGGLTGIPAGLKEFFTGQDYFLGGDAEEKKISFHDSDIVILLAADSRTYGRYAKTDSEITITVGDEVIKVLAILDPVTLKDTQTGEIYGLEGFHETELKRDVYYYQFGDMLEVYLCFRDWEDAEIEPGQVSGGGDVDREDDGDEAILELTGEAVLGLAGVDILSGTFTVRGQTLTVDIEGEVTELVIENSYILRVADQDVSFIRMPDGGARWTGG